MRNSEILIVSLDTVYRNTLKMQVHVLFFGIVADLLGTDHLHMDFSGKNILEFRQALIGNHPVLKSYSNYAIAINEHYATDEELVNEGDTLAIIPPVSGG